MYRLQSFYRIVVYLRNLQEVSDFLTGQRKDKDETDKALNEKIDGMRKEKT